LSIHLSLSNFLSKISCLLKPTNALGSLFFLLFFFLVLTELVVNNSIVVFDFSFDIDSILIP
jgi:hypothetical protein